ncbi:RluA family pseudouridine synthase [Methylophaga sp. OBS3]|uniref:RluA family pseudouridine synthase n=1 Tax=Methylophaga sp. OBS3 TaxID=2991934 RepID=UPI00224CBAE2|nr:RluA family pseudouridine synthase [Methylophaga sp. OBS3]MCX4188896.1 RluA family pseudouridine synthase [Methylophaga sp. OBS3]
MSESPSRVELHHTVEQSGQTALDCLAEIGTLSKQQIKQCMAKGAVWLQKGKHQQRLRRVKKTVSSGEQLHLYFDAHILAQTVPEVSLVMDLKRYSVWNKPAGMLAQGTMWGDHGSLLRVSEQFFTPPRQTFLVHRLDREASGLMMIAHDKQAAALLSALFQSRNVDKQYHVTVQGKLDVAEKTIDQSLDGKNASTTLKVRSYDAETDQTQLLVSIDTGRKHQIRRHCASIGHPVVGDSRYGQAHPDGLQLRAVSLGFDCPITHTKQRLSLIDNHLSRA